MMKTTTYSVLDMTCGGCKNKIETALRAATGVQAVAGDVAEKTVTVTYDETVRSNNEIIQLVKEAGYTAVNQ